jgi:hypothetical protein
VKARKLDFFLVFAYACMSETEGRMDLPLSALFPRRASFMSSLICQRDFLNDSRAFAPKFWPHAKGRQSFPEIAASDKIVFFRIVCAPN